MEGQVIKTDWFDGTVKPAGVGVYERDLTEHGIGLWFSKWDGQYWMDGQADADDANAATSVSAFQEQPWRGIVPEFEGCLPVEQGGDTADPCKGCAFGGAFDKCLISQNLLSCASERVIWRPRSEVR